MHENYHVRDLFKIEITRAAISMENHFFLADCFRARIALVRIVHFFG